MAGASLSGPHPTIANLNVILTDTAANSSLILLASCTGTLDTTASTYQKGCIMYATDVATGTSGTYINVGTAATPVWSQISGNGGLQGGLIYATANSNSTNNLVCVSVFSSGTTKVVPTTGTIVAIKLASTLQAGANTINFNGTSKSLRESTNPANNIQTTYAVGSVILVAYTPGVQSGIFQLLSETK